MLLLGDVGGGGLEFALTSAAKIGIVKEFPETRSFMLGHAGKDGILPEKLNYIAFSRSREDILREVKMSFNRDFSDSLTSNLMFKDFSKNYFMKTVVPSSWTDSDENAMFSDKKEDGLMESLVNFLDANAPGSLVMAAKRLNVTPSTVSARISGLEDDQELSAIEDSEAAVEVVMEIDGGLGVAAAMDHGRELELVAVERDGVVISDAAAVVEGEDGVAVESRGQRAEGGVGLGGGDHEAPVELGQVGGQDLIGLVEGAGLSAAQLFDQPVLEGLPEALDAALSLGRVGANELDAQVGEQASELALR